MLSSESGKKISESDAIFPQQKASEETGYYDLSEEFSEELVMLKTERQT